MVLKYAKWVVALKPVERYICVLKIKMKVQMQMQMPNKSLSQYVRL